MGDVVAFARPATGFFDELALLLAAKSVETVELFMLFEGASIRFVCTELEPVEELAGTLKSLRPGSHFSVKLLMLPAQEIRARAEELRSPRVSDVGQQSSSADQAER